jgi:hypothetical protein
MEVADQSPMDFRLFLLVFAILVSRSGAKAVQSIVSLRPDMYFCAIPPFKANENISQG